MGLQTKVEERHESKVQKLLPELVTGAGWMMLVPRSIARMKQALKILKMATFDG